jgi:PAS domain S-box-containing protein
MEKARKFRSLTVTLAIAFLALSVVVLLIASSLSMYFSFQNQQKFIINEQRFIAQNAANTVKNFVQEKLGILERSAAVSSLSTAGQEKQKTVLERLLGKVPSFRQLVLLDTQKQELSKVSRLSNLASYGFIKRIGSDMFSQVSQGKMHISSVYIDEISSEPMVIMAVPVKDIFGDFKETLLAEVNLKFMWDLVGGIKVGNKGLAYVVDKQGNLIAFGDISRVLKGENLSRLSEVNEFVKGDISTHKDSAKVVKGIQGNFVVATHSPLGMPDWAVVVELPVLEAYETVITTLVISGLIMLLSFALAIIFGVFLSKRIAKPIISLRDAAVRIGEGRLDTQIEIKKKDEIGDLAAAFNQMTGNLRKTTTSIDNLNREIAERKRAEERLLAVNALQKLLLPSLPIEQKLKYVTDAVVRILDADFARIWTIEPGDRCLSGCTHAEVTEGPHVCRFRDKCLHLVASSGRYTHIDGKDHRRVPFGCYKIGLIAAGEQDKFLTNEAATDPRVHNHDWVKELGLVSFVGYRLTHTDGTPLGVLALFSKHPISPAEDALLEGIAHSTSRVIHTSRTEEVLRKSEEFTKRVIESSNDCIKVLDLEGHLLSMSEGGQKLLEICDLTPYLNMSFVDFWKGKDREGCLEAISKAKQGDTGIFYGYFETVKGKPKWWEVIVTPIKNADGGIDRLLAVSRDITERKQAEQRQAQLLEQLEKTNQELKDFAYIVSHDLKAPLRGIKTLAEWITTDYADKLDDNGKEQMNLLAGRVDRMHNLIDGILQYSRIGRAEEEKVVVNLNELVTEVIDMIAPPENITITIENELPTIECEQTRIMQVFQNLLSNAVKYMDKPKGQINVGCVEENGFWEFYVADNGPGIEEKYFEKIFQLFQTLAPRDKSESTGVGLTIIKKIVEMYGGKTWVQSKVGSGSTFFFTLPKQELGVKDAKLEASIIGRR